MDSPHEQAWREELHQLMDNEWAGLRDETTYAPERFTSEVYLRYRREKRIDGSRAVPLVTMRQLLDEAVQGGYGVGAFNVNNLEQVQAIMEATGRRGRPRSSSPLAGPESTRTTAFPTT